jgi:hypothetical protein
MKLRDLTHPLLFALLPAVSLLGHNIDEAPPSHALRPALLSLGLAAIALGAFRRLYRDLPRASAATSIFLILFFSYGHVYSGLVTQGTFDLFNRIGLVGHHEILAPTYAALLLLSVWAVSRLRQQLPTLTTLLTIMGAAAMAVPIVQIARHEIQLSRPWSASTPAAPVEASEAQPDIYYLIVDGYAREDVLRSIYRYDNRPFLEGLSSLGFYVAAEARSNYVQTSLSLASSLNLDYLGDLQPPLPTDGNDRTPLSRLIRWSAVRSLLEQRGYRIVGLPSGYRVTELENADFFLRAPIHATTTLERLAIETSALVLAQDLARSAGIPFTYPGYQAHRDRLLFTLEQLRQSPSIPGPKFVFAHIVLPHPPFVFDAQGEPTRQDQPFTLMDGDAFLGTNEEYLRGYRDQLTYLNGVLPGILRSLIEDSAEPPIILLQADHGPGSRLNWESAEETDLAERTSILSAYFLPGDAGGLLYPTITPVNSFRVVFDAFFGADYPLLPDRTYFSTWSEPYHDLPVP